MEREEFLLNPSSYKATLWLDLEDIVRFENYFKALSLVSKKGKIVFSDFDDTIFSRTPQLSEDRFEKNRWQAGNDLVEYTIWFENFFQKYYNSEMVVKEISDKTDVILTAWRVVVQKWKLKHTWLENKNSIIVDSHKYKPRAMLSYFLENNIYPEIIEFNDDKAFKLLEGFKDLSFLLKNVIVLNNVSLSKDRLNQVWDIQTITIKNWKIIN